MLVTGAASGIGLSAARQLVAAGARRLILADVDGEVLAAEAAGLDAEIVLLPGDVSDEAMWDAAAPHLTDLDSAVLNAGISANRSIEKFDYAAWRRVVSVNLDGTFLGLRAVMRAMKARGDGGSIVVTGSSAGVKTDYGQSAYGVSKAAVHHLVRVAAREGTAARIRVNAVAPGGVATPIWRKVPSFTKLVEDLGSEEAAFAELGKTGTPLGKFTSPDEIAGQILFLLSDACSTVTGEIFLNDGGFTL